MRRGRCAMPCALGSCVRHVRACFTHLLYTCSPTAEQQRPRRLVISARCGPSQPTPPLSLTEKGGWCGYVGCQHRASSYHRATSGPLLIPHRTRSRFRTHCDHARRVHYTTHACANVGAVPTLARASARALCIVTISACSQWALSLSIPRLPRPRRSFW